MSLSYVHVDVFAQRPFSGNSLPVFPNAPALSARQMQRITQELRHFETIFLVPTADPNIVRARVFDLSEELAFAGHPLIGAAAVLHARAGSDTPQRWTFELAAKSVTITTERTPRGYFGLLNQGAPEFLGEVDARESMSTAFALAPDDLRPDLPLEVVSTGLRYLIVPVRRGALQRARVRSDLTRALHGYGAQFAVLLDEDSVEVRHWNNDGIVEDIATGSAAGTIGAYRLRHGLAVAGDTFVLNQGRYTGRPSELRVRPEGSPGSVSAVFVGGDVALVGSGKLDVLPEMAA